VTEFRFPCVSVASSGGEYFQVSFEEDQDSDSAYFLIQRQFESDDGGSVYVESLDRTLCGHFKIRSARLGRNTLRLELDCQTTETVQIWFQTNDARYKQLRRVLKMMVPSSALDLVSLADQIAHSA
jgi:hypothetical protein